MWPGHGSLVRTAGAVLGCDWWVGSTHLYSCRPPPNPLSLPALVAHCVCHGKASRQCCLALHTCSALADCWCYQMALVHQVPSCVWWRLLHAVGRLCTLFVLLLLLPPSWLCRPVLLSCNMAIGTSDVFLLGIPGNYIAIHFTAAALAPVCVPCGPQPFRTVTGRWHIGLVAERVGLSGDLGVTPAVLNFCLRLYEFFVFIFRICLICTEFVCVIFLIWVITFFYNKIVCCFCSLSFQVYYFGVFVAWVLLFSLFFVNRCCGPRWRPNPWWQSFPWIPSACVCVCSVTGVLFLVFYLLGWSGVLGFNLIHPPLTTWAA